mgnify:FL=1
MRYLVSTKQSKNACGSKDYCRRLTTIVLGAAYGFSPPWGSDKIKNAAGNYLTFTGNVF